MATIIDPRSQAGGDHRFFMISALVMAAIVVLGFSFQLAMGRSTFAAPLLVHAHALLFMGWVGFYVLQNALVATGSVALHKRLGWIGLAWMPAMVAMGVYTTLTMVRRGAAPFFFEPAYFLVMNSINVTVFAGLGIAAIMMRRRTDWHRRLHFCGMAFLIAPAFGRLLPMPLMIPWAGLGVFVAVLVLPFVGAARDLRRNGRVHPAWWWGIGTMALAQVAVTLIAYSGTGIAIYDAATAGYPGAAVAPLEFPPPPMGPLVTGGE